MYFPVKLARFSTAFFSHRTPAVAGFQKKQQQQSVQRFFRDTSYAQLISYHLQLSP